MNPQEGYSIKGQLADLGVEPDHNKYFIEAIGALSHSLGISLDLTLGNACYSPPDDLDELGSLWFIPRSEKIYILNASETQDYLLSKYDLYSAKIKVSAKETKPYTPPDISLVITLINGDQLVLRNNKKNEFHNCFKRFVNKVMENANFEQAGNEDLPN